MIGSCAGTFYAFDKQSGQRRWSYDIKMDGNQTSFHGNPLVTDDLTLIGTDGSGVGHVYAFERATGKVVWKHPVTRNVSGNAGATTDILASGANAYVVTIGDELLCLDSKTGRLNWSFHSGFTGNEFMWSRRPAVSRDLVFFGNPHGGDGGAESLACLDLPLTKVRWNRKATGDVLYIGTLNGTVYAYSTGQDKKPTPEEVKGLRAELEKMMEEDQKFRTRLMEVEEKYGPNSKELAALWKEQTEIDNRLLKRLEEIVKQYGWPARSLVGAEASLAAFLIIQHADYEYQKKYFPLIKEAMEKGEIAPGHVALLEDRILMREGKRQIYGSQLRRNEKTGKYELWPVEDEENLDKRRASIGLEPIAEYLKRFGVTYIPPKKR